jgi:signal transduction histidine kinase
VLGRSVVDFWKDREGIAKSLQDIISGQGGHGEFVAQRKDGSAFVVFVSAGPIKSGNGENSSIMASCIDITETKKMEIESSRQKRELELYASILKHDIGNDIQILLSYIESLDPKLPLDNPEHQERIKPIQASIFRMRKLLNSLGASDESEENTLPKMLDNIAKTSEEIHEGLKINIEIQKEVHELSTTGFRFLHIVFENLIRNTAQHAGDNPVVSIYVKRTNGNVTIDLVDNGDGIPNSLRTDLFKKGTTTNGSGLGLYLARQILSIYNGTIELIESKENEGAKFRIVIPLQPSL